jgi:copper chaperone CopZ
MRKLLVALIAFGFALVAQAETVDLKIDGMVCSKGCVSKVNKALTKVKGVNNKDSKVELGKAKIDFDASKTSKADIIKAIEKAGFEVVSK